jgi:hypothetical protein
MSDSAQAQEQFRGFTWERPTANVGLRFASEDLNFGLGLGGGYTLNPGIYIGGLFDYFFGEDGFDAWMLMAEGGYDFGVADRLVLRPSLALGVITASYDAVCGAGVCFGGGSDSSFELGLGGQALYDLGSVTLGGELRIMLGDFETFFLVGANVGMVF